MSDTVAEGTTCKDHAKIPDGYLQACGWAERKSKTHTQRRCAECGLWEIWLPKHIGGEVMGLRDE